MKKSYVIISPDYASNNQLMFVCSDRGRKVPFSFVVDFATKWGEPIAPQVYIDDFLSREYPYVHFYVIEWNILLKQTNFWL